MIAKIAGRSFELHYRARTVAEAEDEIGKSVQAAVGQGLRLRELAALVRAGVVHLERSWKTAKVLDLIDQHVEGEGNIERQIYAPVVITLAEAGFLGDTDPELIRKNILGEEGKDTPGTPKTGPASG